MVWAFPRSLATTCGIISYFLLLQVLRCFSSLGFLPLGSIDFIYRGCPIRTSADQWLFAPPRSFSQLIASFVVFESLGIHHTPLFASNSSRCFDKSKHLMSIFKFALMIFLQKVFSYSLTFLLVQLPSQFYHISVHDKITTSVVNLLLSTCQ